MSEQDTVDFRLNLIDDKLTSIDEKFDVFGDKLDKLKSDLNQTKCAAPNTCLTLQMQNRNFAEMLDRVSKRLDEAEKHHATYDLELDRIKNCQRIGLWALGFVGSLLVFFSGKIQMLLEKIF